MTQFTNKPYEQYVNGINVGLQPTYTYLASRKMSFRSRLARNVNILQCSLISVMALGGRECPTATKPTGTFSKQASEGDVGSFGSCFIFK